MFRSQGSRSIPFDRTIQPGIFHKSTRLDRAIEAIDQFIWNKQSNFLLLFGPSGSGKTSILNFYLNSKRLEAVWEQGEQFDQGYADGLRRVQLPEIILKVCSRCSSRQIHVFTDFPTSNPEFSKICKFAFATCQAKVIFLLNSTIYKYVNSYLSKKLVGNHFKTTEGEELDNTTILEIKSYSVPQLKKIGEEFRKKNGFEGRSQILEELAELAHGDARRMINNVWMSMINQFKAIKGQDDSNNSKQTDRTTIFHFMGKLLYNKRISPDVFIFEEEPEESSKNASIKAFEKSNNIRQMSYEELKFYDPPFYFNPVDLLRNSGLDCKLIEMLLQENYIDFYFNMVDVATMATLFADLDTLENPRKPFYTRQQLDDLEVFMLGWGIMLYNLHCSQGKSRFRSFRKSGLVIYQKQIKNKRMHLRRAVHPTRTFQIMECAAFHPTICHKVLDLADMFTIKRRNHNDGSVQENQIVIEQSPSETNGSNRFLKTPKLKRPKFVPPSDPEYDDIEQDT